MAPVGAGPGDNSVTMRWKALLPESIRRNPDRVLTARYESGSGAPPSPATLDGRVGAALEPSGARWSRTGETSWLVDLDWQTMVLGLVRRDVEERVDVRIAARGGAWGLEVSCHPKGLQDAHAAGAAAVLAVAVAVWLVGGWVQGASAGVATLLAGALWLVVTREMAFTLLDRRLARLAADVGTAVWPGRHGAVGAGPPPPR